MNFEQILFYFLSLSLPLNRRPMKFNGFVVDFGAVLLLFLMESASSFEIHPNIRYTCHPTANDTFANEANAG